jgi:hypothetical protein
MDPKRAADVTRTLPAVIGTTTNPEHARVHTERLTQAGLQVEVREVSGSGRQTAPEAPAQPQPAAPAKVAAERPAAPRASLGSPTPAVQDSSAGGGYALGDLDLSSRTAAKPQPAPEAPRQAAPAQPATPPKAEVPDAFSGLRTFEDSFGTEAQDQNPALELENTAQRASKVAPAPAAPVRAQRKLSLGERFQKLLQALGVWLMSWVPHSIAFCIVAVISAAAVSFGLDPDHVLDDVAIARAQSTAQELWVRANQLVPR